ncbi:MAG: hypothetical protein ACYDER_13815 [Ktedonobacteraceae bacterium]
MVSSTDVWAVGQYNVSPNVVGFQPLIEQWNGSNWDVVPSPNPNPDANGNALGGVASVSPTDVWAVGSYSYNGSNNDTLVEQWNGTSWSIVPSPNVGAIGNELNGVIAISSTDIWAVGVSYNNNACCGQTLVEQWNGASWIVVLSP